MDDEANYDSVLRWLAEQCSPEEEAAIRTCLCNSQEWRHVLWEHLESWKIMQALRGREPFEVIDDYRARARSMLQVGFFCIGKGDAADLRQEAERLGISIDHPITRKP